MRRPAKAPSAASNPGKLASALALAVAVVLAFAAPASAAEALIPFGGTFASPGSEPGQISKPRHTAVEQSTGNLFVADTGNGRIDVFRGDGSFLTSFGEADLDAPVGVAIRESGGQTQVYVSDSSVNKILRFDSDEAATPSFSVDNLYVSPAAGSGPDKIGSFAAALALAPNGDLWVADPGDNLIQRFLPSGTYAGTSINGGGSSKGAFTGLLDVAVDSTGRVYAVDAKGRITGDAAGNLSNGPSRVERFAADGTFQLTLPGLHRPAAVAVDPATDEVAVSADQDAVENNKAPTLHVFSPAGSERFTRVMEASTYTTVQGLAFSSSARYIWSVHGPGYWAGNQFGSEGIFRHQVVNLPTVTLAAATNVGYTSADLAGTVDPMGTTATAHFELSSNGGSTWTDVSGDVPVCEATKAGDCTSGPVPVAFSATGLNGTTNYKVRIRATVGGGASSLSTVGSFTTEEVNPPAVAPPTFSEVTASGAKVAGSITLVTNPDPAFDASCRFEYVTQAAFDAKGFEGAESRSCDVGVDSTDPQPVAVKSELTGLEPNQTYHLRLVASNSGGTVATPAAATFVTQAVAPEVDSAPAIDTAEDAATLAGYVNPHNSAFTDCHFEFGPTASYGQQVACQALPTGNKRGVASVRIGGLAPGTQYHFKLVVANAIGGAETTDRVFSTLPAGSQPQPEGCPNEAIRSQQNATLLPACRAYEMVSSADKASGTISAKPFNGAGQPIVSAIAPSGDAAAYWAYAGFADSPSAHQNSYRSTRTAQGWVNNAVIPTLPGPGGINIVAGKAQAVGVTPDLSRFFLRTGLAFDSQDQRPKLLGGLISPFDVYSVSPGEKAEWASRPDGFTVDTENYNSEWVGASDDGRHVFFQTEEALTPAAEGRIAGSNLYERFDGHTRLVGVDDSGDALSECGSVLGPFNHSSAYFGAVSSDASRVYVTSPDPGVSWNPSCTEQPDVYLRAGDQTVDASRSRRATPDPDPKPAYFMGAAKDGSVAYILSDEALTEDASLGADGILYRYDAKTDQLTLAVPGEVTGMAAISVDGSRIYVPRGPVGGDPDYATDIFVYSASDDQVRRVATGAGYYAIVNDGGRNGEARTTADGKYLLFPSKDNLTSFDSHGRQELYRYNAVNDDISCVSCAPDGAAPTADTYIGTANSLDNIFPVNRPIGRNLSSDGRRAFFETANALVPRDVNKAPDVYEWFQGRGIALVSDGSAERGSYFFGASESGRDVFISTQASLLPQDIDNGDVDVYDARIDGGFAGAPNLASCEGDGCQGQPETAPAVQTGTTSQFSGPPSKSERKVQKKKKQKKHRKKRHGRKAHGKKTSTQKGR